MKAKITQYVSFDQISQVALNIIQNEIGLENIEAIGYGVGAYAKAPLIIKTKNGETYKLTTTLTLYKLQKNKWKTIKKHQ